MRNQSASRKGVNHAAPAKNAASGSTRKGTPARQPASKPHPARPKSAPTTKTRGR